MGSLVLVVYCQYFVVSIGSVRLIQAGIAVAILVFESSYSTRRRDGSSKMTWGALAILMVWVGAAFAIAEIAARLAGDPGLARNIQLIFGVGPLYAALGWTILGSSFNLIYGRVFACVSVAMAVAAMVEYISGQSMVGRPEFAYLAREEDVRALVAADHPLVLGGLLVAALPFAALFSGAFRHLVALTLFAGVWCTGSRGPFGIAAVILVVVLLPGAAWVIQRYWRAVFITGLFGFCVLAIFSVFVWKPEIWGYSSLEYSTNYRSAIYALTPRLLTELPVGYAAGSIPPGVWVLPSEWKGLRDIAVSVDSELVLLIFQIGWIGLGLFIGVTMMCAHSLRYSVLVGGAALAVSLTGLFLALHAWDGLGAVWWVLIGAAGAQIRMGRSAVSGTSAAPKQFSMARHQEP